jgi:hypothetical protein
MLVVIINNQIIAPERVCQACLMARDGQPRWQQGKLGCGRLVHNLNCCPEPQSDTYVCQMGFRLVDV